MKSKKGLENITKYTLMALLVVNFFGAVLVSIINPESLFLGQKMVGTRAVIYLLAMGATGLIVAYLLLKNVGNGESMSILYFGFLFIESLATNTYLGLGFLVSPIYTAGLIISVMLFVIRKRRKGLVE
jgi:hypothetical protein